MLQRLSIRDIVLIDRLDLTFHPGLCVLTGETGAGKSILLDALGLAVGARGDVALLRPGAARASVSAAFEPGTDHPVRAVLEEHGMESDGPVVLRRVLYADGRTRAYVNDEAASVGLLRRLGACLVEIQGHYEQQGLLDPSTHRRILDSFAGLGPLVAETRAAHRAWQEAAEALAAARERADRARAEESFLRHSLEELDALAPQAGEEAALAERRSVLMHREKIVAALQDAHAELVEGRPVDDAIRAAQRILERAALVAGDAFTPVVAALERAALEVSEAVRGLQAMGHDLESDARGLEEIEERLFALRDLARKHRTEVDALPALREDMAARVAAVEDLGAEIARLETAVDAARAAYVRAAEALSARRAEAAGRLRQAVEAELPPLRLEKARFAVRVEPLDAGEWNAEGMDRVLFQVATNPGVPLGPLAKISSAGELSRFMLALKVVLARDGSPPVLIFDEVDSGIGGAAAAAVGDRLARLGRDRQVLVVTHSPQVAARGSHHWRVHKTGGAAGVVTRVDELDDRARREEIARMLSGARITDEARAAAASLIVGDAR